MVPDCPPVRPPARRAEMRRHGHSSAVPCTGRLSPAADRQGRRLCHVLICYLVDVNALLNGDGTRCAAPSYASRGHIRPIIVVQQNRTPPCELAHRKCDRVGVYGTTCCTLSFPSRQTDADSVEHRDCLLVSYRVSVSHA